MESPYRTPKATVADKKPSSPDLIGCGSEREMAEHEESIRSSTASTTTSPPAPPFSSSTSSPPNHHNHHSTTSIHSRKGETPDFHPSSGRVPLSPMCNGYSNSSPRKSKEEGDVQNSSGVCVGEGGGGGGGDGGNTRPGSSSNPPPNMDRLPKEESPQMSVLKQERDQDGPLDFSVKRRDSVSESFTDDSRASSSISPPSYPGAPQAYSSSTSMRHSPEAEHHHYARRQAVPPPLPPSSQHHPLHHQRHHSGSSVGAEGANHFHKLPHLGCSPGSSPDHGELIGQPKTAPKMPPGSLGSRSPVNSSLAALGMMAEGGGGSMTPAAMAAMMGQNGGMLGSVGNLSAFMTGDLRKVMGANGGKVQRPFKAYPKEALQMPLGYLGLPGINPFPNLDHSSLQGVPLSQEEMISMYKQQLDFLKEREKQMMNMSKMSTRSPPSSTGSSTSSSSSFGGISANGSSNSMTHPAPPPPPPPPALSQSSISHSHPGPPPLPTTVAAAAAAASSYFPPTSHSSSSTTTLSLPLPHHSPAAYSHIPSSTPATSPFPTPTVPPLVSSTSSISSGGRKRPRSLPDDQKDDAYWERRRKNNDAAKRSRDARRAKEDEIAIRAALLEQENLKLRVEVAALKTETARLRCLLYNA